MDLFIFDEPKFNFRMFRIKILKIFIQTDTNRSLQRELSGGKVFNESKKQTYDSIVKIADKIKFKTALSAKERVLAVETNYYVE
jgi:hypothetical protein